MDLVDRPDVFSVVIDQCVVGLMNAAGELHRKATKGGHIFPRCKVVVAMVNITMLPSLVAAKCLDQPGIIRKACSSGSILPEPV